MCMVLDHYYDSFIDATHPQFTQVTNQLALCSLAEFVFHFTRLDPEMFQIARDTGRLTQTFLTFEISEKGM